MKNVENKDEENTIMSGIRNYLPKDIFKNRKSKLGFSILIAFPHPSQIYSHHRFPLNPLLYIRAWIKP